MSVQKSNKSFSSVEQIFKNYLPAYTNSNEKQTDISGKVGVKIAQDLLMKFEHKINNPKLKSDK